MKKLAKTLFMSLIAAAASSAIAADMNTKLVSFSTGALTYADGQKVVDGERFAFCYTPDGEFDGLTSDLKAIGEESGEKVICIVPLNVVDGVVVPTTFLVNDDYTDGAYVVLMLDTRTSATTVAKNFSADAVNGVAKTSLSVVAKGTGAQDGVTVGSDFAAETFVKSPASLTISTEGNALIVKAVNLSPVVKYQIKSGETLSDLKSVNFKVSDVFTGFTGTENVSVKDGNATFVVTDSEDKFFQLLQAE